MGNLWNACPYKARGGYHRRETNLHFTPFIKYTFQLNVPVVDHKGNVCNIHHLKYRKDNIAT